MTRIARLASYATLCLAVAVGLLACAGGGGGGSSSGSAASTSGSGSGGTSGQTQNAPSGFTGTDSTPPTYAADALSGASTFHSGSAVVLSGSAHDAESGVSTVTVNGGFATLGGTVNDTTWQASPALSDGVNIVEIEVADQQGNVTTGWWGIFYAEQYLNPADPVPNAGVVYVSDDGFTAFSTIVNGYLTQNNQLAQTMVNQGMNLPLTTSLGFFTASIINVAFDAPQLTLAPAANGLTANVVLPNLVVDVALAGTNVTLVASQARVDAVVNIAVQNGQYVVTLPTFNVQLVSPQFQNAGALSALLTPLAGTVGSVAGAAVQSTLPGAMEQALNSFTPSYSQDIMGVTFTATAQPTTILYSTDGIEIDVEANVTSNATGTVAGPGSLGFAAPGRPALSQTHHVTAALHTSLVNRALYTAWESGLLQITVDQQLLSQYGVSLPFQLDGRWIAMFFPPIQALITNPSQPVPIGLQLAFDLPPSVGLSGATPNIRGAYAGCRASVVMDFGTGYTPVLSVEVAGEVSADVSSSAQAIDVTLTQPTTFRFDLTGAGNPLNLNTGNVNSFLNMALGQLITFVGQLIPSIPVPALPAFNGPQVQIQQLDTEFSSEYVTVKASVQ